MNRTICALATALLLTGPAMAEPTRVVVVGIDKKTQDALGPFGGSYRAHHARLIQKLNAAKVRGIGFAIYFPESPENSSGTTALATSAKLSKAPVVVSVYTEETPDGAIAKLPNAAALQSPKIGHGSTLVQRELLVTETPDGLSLRTGELMLRAESAGHRSLVEELLIRSTPTQPGDLQRLGLIEDVTTGVRTGTNERKTTAALRPEIDTKPLTLSYIDVLRKGPHPDLRGALVIVGINDGVQDLQENPNPDRPKLKKVSGVFVHAALLERLVREVPKRHMEAEAAKREKAEAKRRADDEAAQRKTAGGKLGISQKIEPKPAKTK